jgi:signal transduction histidine kinase
VSRGRSLGVVAFAVLGATLLFWLLVHQISGLWLDVALRPEVREVLEHSLEDQKLLRTLDSAHRDEYRRRFEQTNLLLRRLAVIRLNRAEMQRRFELTLLVLFVAGAAIAGSLMWMRYRRAQARERREYLDRVSVLQETARRQAHELKGPLTAARLELERLGDVVRRGAPQVDVLAAAESIAEELERLARFTRAFASFAAIGTPVLRPLSLRTAVEEFCATFANAWPGVALRWNGTDTHGDARVCADGDLLRQVLVNLCTNSARAIEGAGWVTFTLARASVPVALDVSDSGGGIPESLRARIFDPYVTTRRMGEGMGLGLSISRKIMLDHGGDLQLVATSAAGTTFRLTFGDAECS